MPPKSWKGKRPTKEELAKILEDHKKWVEEEFVTAQEEGREPSPPPHDLSGADLSEMDLSLEDLRGAILVQAKLRGTSFELAVLEGANLNGADLTGAKLTEADLQYADLRGARLAWAYLDVANLGDVQVDRGTSFEGALLVKALGREPLRHSQAKINYAAFDFEDLLRPAKINLVCKWGKAIPPLRPTGVELQGILENHEKWVEEEFFPAQKERRRPSSAPHDLSGADLSRMDLRAKDLRGAFLVQAKLRRTRLENAILERANLNGADLTGARLTGAKLQHADLRGARLAWAYLDEANLENIQVDQKTSFMGALLLEATGREQLRGSQANVNYAAFEPQDLFRPAGSKITCKWGTPPPRSPGLRPTQAELEAMLEDHKKWVEEEFLPAQKEGRKLPPPPHDLSRADLSTQDFSDAELRGITLEGATLDHSYLKGADLRYADLRGASLKDAKLIEAKLQYAKLSGADFYRAILNKAKLEGARLESSREDNEAANLIEADLSEAELPNASLVAANLTRAYLPRANLEGAELGTADLSLANLQQANLKGARLESATLEGANLRQADLSSANLKKAKLGPYVPEEENSQAHLPSEPSVSSQPKNSEENSSYQPTILSLANLKEADLTGADLTQADLRGANLLGAEIEGANFTGANLERALLFTLELRQALWQPTEGKPGLDLEASLKYISEAVEMARKVFRMMLPVFGYIVLLCSLNWNCKNTIDIATLHLHFSPEAFVVVTALFVPGFFLYFLWYLDRIGVRYLCIPKATFSGISRGDMIAPWIMLPLCDHIVEAFLAFRKKMLSNFLIIVVFWMIAIFLGLGVSFQVLDCLKSPNLLPSSAHPALFWYIGFVSLVSWGLLVLVIAVKIFSNLPSPEILPGMFFGFGSALITEGVLLLWAAQIPSPGKLLLGTLACSVLLTVMAAWWGIVAIIRRAWRVTQ